MTTILDPRFSPSDSRIPIPDPQFPIPDPRFSTPDSLISATDSRLLATFPRRLPPSYRDVEIYQWVIREGCTRREAAARRNISQTRVRQIVRRVIEWLAEVLPEQPETDRQRETRLAQQMTADRLLHAYQQLMTAWQCTQDPKFISRATRITVALGKLGVVPGAIDGLLADAIEAVESHPPPSDPFAAPADVPERRVAASAAVQNNPPANQPESFDHDLAIPAGNTPAPQPPVAPPVRDCSHQREEPALPEPAASFQIAASATGTNDCDAEFDTHMTEIERLIGVRAPLLATRDRLPVTALHLTPNEPGITPGIGHSP